jgi:hypothetical protein
MNELIACTLVVVEAEAKGNGLEMLERRIMNGRSPSRCWDPQTVTSEAQGSSK